MDLDSDGILDILSGSWPGELYFFRGEGKGRFAAGKTIQDRDGRVIRPGNASTVFANDWNGDGRLDLLAGCIEGHVYFIPNHGSGSSNAFGKAEKLTAGGKMIQLEQHDSHPTVADWDQDGSPDLIVGAGDGSVLWYRNAGSRREPKLEAARVLLAAPPQAKPGDSAGNGLRGTRAKVCVTDWNGDGTLDLLVGDFSVSRGPAPRLSAADRTEEQKARTELAAASRELESYSAEMRKLGQPPADPDRRSAWERQAQAIGARHKEPLARMNRARMALSRFQSPFTYNGFVWLVPGKPASVASQP